jgi:hypothetical protein
LIPELRRRFNEAFTPEKYAELQALLARECGTPISFRNCETPCFFERALLEKMAAHGRELVEQLMGDTAYLAAASETIPPAYRVPNEAQHPLFVQVDFGLDERREPVLVEIQGFPSLYAYQPALAEAYREIYALPAHLTPFLGGLDEETYHEHVRRAIVGDHEPENVVLLEIEPFRQKTLPDFLLTERYYGVGPVGVDEVIRQGKRLFYKQEGRLIPIERIYNRVIVDELQRTGTTLPFDLRDDLDIEWAGHPNWYFKISKFSLPFLKHPCVPETHFLDQLPALPADLEDWVLKPLFSFAGLGVKVGPTRDEVEAATDRALYILQRRVDFVPVIETPHGPTKVEVRVMYIWQDELRPLTTLLRMGRGKMMGVDHNRDAEWVGASAAFMPSQ